MSQEPVNDWSWWMDALEGNRRPLPSRAPMPGYFRAGERALAVYYSEEDGSLQWNLTGNGWQPQDSDAVTDLYATACTYPIPYEVWQAIDNGEEWPPHLLVNLSQADIAAGVAWHPEWARKRFAERQEAARQKREAEQAAAVEAARIAAAKDVTEETEVAAATLAKVGHNSGEPHLVTRDRLNAILEACKRWHDEEVHGKITTEAENLKALGWQQEAQELRIDAEKRHKAEKQPHLDAGRAVDEKWIKGENSITNQAKALEDYIKGLRTPFEVAEAARKKAEAQAAKEAADRAAAEAEAARIAAGPIPQAQFEAPAAKPKRQAAAPRERVATTLKSRVSFDDPAAAIRFFAGIGAFQLDVNALLTTHVLRQHGNGVAVPGARVIMEEVAR